MLLFNPKILYSYNSIFKNLRSFCYIELAGIKCTSVECILTLHTEMDILQILIQGYFIIYLDFLHGMAIIK